MDKGADRLSVRKGSDDDLDAVSALVCRAVAEMDRRGIQQWDALYPDRAVFAADIRAGALYLALFDGTPAAVFTLSETMDEAYQNGRWQYPGSRFAVLHRLCVDPAFQGRGIGRRVCRAAEDIARGLGYTSLRLDAFSQNPYALRMYDDLGYTRTGTAQFRKGLFYLMEKSLAAV